MLKVIAVLLSLIIAYDSAAFVMGRNRHRQKRHGRDQGLIGAPGQRKATLLNLGLLNVDTWNHKSCADVEAAIASKNIDIFSLTETFFRVEDKQKIEIAGFLLYESRREDAKKDRRGGGLACLVKEIPGLTSKQLHLPIRKPTLSYVNSERMWVAVESEYGRTAVATVYISCQTTDDKWFKFNSGIYEVLGEEVSGHDMYLHQHLRKHWHLHQRRYQHHHLHWHLHLYQHQQMHMHLYLHQRWHLYQHHYLHQHLHWHLLQYLHLHLHQRRHLYQQLYLRLY